MVDQTAMKRKYLIPCILADLLAFLPLLLNALGVNLSEWTVFLAILLMIVSIILFFVKGGGKMLSKLLLTLCALLCGVCAVFSSYCNPYWNNVSRIGFAPTAEYDAELTYEEALADLEYAMHYLKKLHPLFMDGVPQEVQLRYDSVVSKLQSTEQITVTMLEQELAYLVSGMGDAHTYFAQNSANLHYLRLLPQWQENGSSLIAVNDIPLSQILEDSQEHFSYESKGWHVYQLSNKLKSLEGLAFLGFEPTNGISITVEHDDGSKEIVNISEDDFITLDAYRELLPADDAEEHPFVSYEIFENENLAVLTLLECIYNEEYIGTLRQFFTEVKENGITNIAVDVRDNGGGNSLVCTEFLRYLDIAEYYDLTGSWRLGWFEIPFGDSVTTNAQYTDLLYTGDVYLLTSESSFSSAMMFAEYIKDNALGTLIGEAPGNAPAAFGDIVCFQTPHSGLLFQISTKTFHRMNPSCTELLVEPDIPCDADDAMDVLMQEIQ